MSYPARAEGLVNMIIPNRIRTKQTLSPGHERQKNLWMIFEIKTDHLIHVRRPDLVIISNQKKKKKKKERKKERRRVGRKR